MKIELINNVAIVTSDITKEEMLAARKHAPDALVVKDEEGNQVFKVDFDEQHGGVSKHGVTFNTITDDGRLAVTDMLPNFEKKIDKVEFLKNSNGIALTKLANFETTIKEQIGTVTESINGVFAELEAEANADNEAEGR